MNYKFKIGEENLLVWIWDDEYHDHSIEIYNGKNNYKKKIKEDENGEYFMWRKAKVYLKDYISYSLKELNEKLKDNENMLTEEDLVLTILREGVENVRFLCPLSKVETYIPQLGLAICGMENKPEVLCKVIENQYKVKDDYKIEVTPIDDKGVTGRSFYTSDFFSLLKQGIIKIAS